MDGGLDPGPPDDEPYSANRAMLPRSLPAALDALERDSLFRAKVGEVFVDYFLRLKRNETGRFAQWLKDAGVQEGEEPTEWEQSEYFDFF
jgi:glutamine synthetase